MIPTAPSAAPATRVARPIVSLIALLALLSACATHQHQRPQWIDGPSSDYPPARYLTAVGSADHREDAAARALAGLAQIFSVAINESSRDDSAAQRQQQRDASGELISQTQSTTRVSRTVQTFTQKQLEGAQVAAHWEDEQGRSYALAVLPRQPLANALRREIQQLDQHTGALLRRAQNRDDPLAAARLYYQGGAIQQHRAGLQKDLRIVDNTGLGIEPRWTVGALEAATTHALGQIPARVTIGHDPLGKLAGQVSAGLKQAGFTLDDTGSYELAASLALEEPFSKDGWIWYRGALELALKRDGRTLTQQRWPLKAAGATDTIARSRLHDQINRQLQRDLRAALLKTDRSKSP